MKPIVDFEWIKNLSYQDVWDKQTSIHLSLIDEKRENRGKINIDNQLFRQQHKLLFCENYHVFTLGKSGSMDHLLLSPEELENGYIEFFKINRGGDITYHGPGQITGYPIFDLDEFYNDVHKYVRMLEEAVILTLSKYGLSGLRISEYTGVWLPPNDKETQFRKICAIGVHLSRWVSMHGFAFNINTDLSYFKKIIPCGIIDENKSVTSLSNELGRNVDLEEVGKHLLDSFQVLFDFELKE